MRRLRPVAGLALAALAAFVLLSTASATHLSSSVLLMSSASSPTYGDPTMLTAWVYGVAPSGTVTFRDGGTLLVTAPVAGGKATFSVDALTVGSHAFTAQYSGDSSNGAASGSSTVSVGKAQPALTTGSPSPADGSATLMIGASASLMARDLPSDATGTIVFTDGSTALCSTPVTAGRASCSSSQLPFGASTVTATYGGDTNYLSASVTSSANVQKASVTMVAGSPTVASGGSTVTLGSVANLGVTGLPGDATGTVVFTDGSLTLCSAAVTGGQASCSSSLLPVGTSTVAASYGGDGNYLSAAATASANVAKAPVVGASTSAAGPQSGSTRTFAFSVKGYPAAATGSITFLFGSGATPLCQATLSAGGASCVATVPGAGTVVASYSGDASYAASSIAGIGVTPSKATSTLSLEAPAGSVTAAVGDEITFAAAISTPANDAIAPTGAVTFFIGTRTACTDSISAGEAECAATVLPGDGGALSAAYAGSSTTNRSTVTGGTLALSVPVQVPAQTTSSTPTSTAATTTTSPATTIATITTATLPSTTTAAVTTTSQTTTTAQTNRALVIKIQTTAGVRAAGAPLTVSGDGLEPGSTVDVVVHSTPTLLGQITVGPDGSFSQVFSLPQGLPAGSHHLIVTGTGANGSPLTQIAAFAVDPQGRFGTQTPAAVQAPTPPLIPAATSTTTPQPTTFAATPPAPAVAAPALPRFEPRQHPRKVVDSVAGGIALLSVLGAAGAVGAAGANRDKGDRSERDQVEAIAKPTALPFLMLTSIKNKDNNLKWEGEAPGDASWTWRLPGRATIDRLSLALPVRLAPVAPLGARLLGDANYLRAVIGSASVALSASALGLGIAAAVSTGASAVTPALGLVIALVVVGVLDGLAGFVATVAYAMGVAVQGGIDSTSSVRMILGVSALWFGVPLIAAAARPFRRPIEDLAVADLWTHTADLLIAALAGAWATQKIIGALPLLSGVVPPLVGSQDLVAVIVLCAIGVRFVLETAAAVLYPRRLTEVQPAQIPSSSGRQRLMSLIVRTSLFVFVADAFIGQCWELYAGAAIFAIPQMLRIFEARFPRSQQVAILVPGGIVKTVLMLFVGAWFFSEFHHRLSSEHLLTYGFVILGLPSLLFAFLELLGRDGRERKENWLQRFLGLGILILGVLFVFGRLT